MDWLLSVEDQVADAPITLQQLQDIQGGQTARGVRRPGGGERGNVGSSTGGIRRVSAEGPTTPPREMVEQLVEMGFSEAESVDALQATGGMNPEAACSWLLGDRDTPASTPPPISSSPNTSTYVPSHRTHVHDHLNQHSRGGHQELATQHILEHPLILQGLQSEHVSRAFRNMIMNPQSAPEYLSDPQVGPILIQMHNMLANSASESSENLFEDSQN
eukprot:CAMPEP_0196583586 /NCGR_PEP_ID=MMETSP1081-20130531/44005_1 /TAXON_ID=36882 /ORGANISM="Pyramimonas amylifera, Strain CCMP720" /LENGTH=216 /DNA_ID=CAMNT_0041904521 /DNA_START=42 /DNA_END=692 /DNA_ORIENTATION=+